MKNRSPNKRSAGKGGIAVLWRAGRARPALPDRERWPNMTRFLHLLAMLLLLNGCASNKQQASEESEHPSILDKLLLPSDVVARVKAAECDLPTDKWETLSKIGRTNRSRCAREGSLGIELLEKIKPQLPGMSVRKLLDSLKTFPYPGYGSFDGVEYAVYQGGNEMIIEELKRRPKSQLAALTPFREDRRAIWTGDSGPPLSVGELVRYDLFKEPY